MKKALVLMVGLLSVQGCSSIEKVSDEDLARGIEIAARGAAQYGLGFVFNKEPGRAAQVAEGARLAVRTLKETIIPAFAGVTTEEVLRSTVEAALDELTAKLTPSVVLAVQLALDLVSANVKLPENPTDRLSERTRLALLALFKGLADGLEVASEMAPTRDTAPAKLFWPKP